MAITVGTQNDPNKYVVPEDITKTLEDGRVIQVAAKGTAMPMAQAVKMGFVTVSYQPGPSETKIVGPQETKIVAPEETKTEGAGGGKSEGDKEEKSAKDKDDKK